MKPQKSKHQLSNELSELVQEYINSGGAVNTVPNGTSGNLNNTNHFKSATHFEPKNERTSLGDVVKTLDERKTNKTNKPSLGASKRPKKRLIVDDFGEPVRWVWDE